MKSNFNPGDGAMHSYIEGHQLNTSSGEKKKRRVRRIKGSTVDGYREISSKNDRANAIIINNMNEQVKQDSSNI